MVDFALDGGFADGYGLVEVGDLVEEVAIVGFEFGKFGVVCSLG